MIHIAKDFDLPLDLVTQTVAVLAKRGVGKTYTGSVMAEEMLKAGQQVVTLDPTGAWWGLRSGFPVVIFGGEHADVPIEAGAGEVIAQAIVGGRLSAVIDLSLFRKNESIKFVTAFLETLYRLNREAVHLFVDEADDICPQKIQPQEAQMVGALEDVVKRGRKKGIGCTLITQRPADLAKQVLTQCEILVAMRLTHPRDIGAIKEWVNVHADPVEAAKMITSLPSLPVGNAWFWAPGWGDIFQRVHVRRRETFDSSATPKPGEVAAKPKHLQEIDLAALGEQIKATVERAKENDPAALKRRIHQLESALQSAGTRTVTKTDPAAMEAVFRAAVTKTDALWKKRFEKALLELSAPFSKIQAVFTEFVGEGTPPIAPKFVNATVDSAPRGVQGLNPGPVVHDEGRVSAPHLTLSKAERLILAALSQYPQGRSKIQVALLTEYSHSGGGFLNAISSLRGKYLIEGGPELLRLTQAGAQAIGPVDPLPRGVDLLRRWQAQLGRAEREILDVLYESYPNPLSKSEVAERTSSKYQPDGGGFTNSISKLRTLELIKGKREMVLSEELIG